MLRNVFLDNFYNVFNFYLKNYFFCSFLNVVISIFTFQILNEKFETGKNT